MALANALSFLQSLVPVTQSILSFEGFQRNVNKNIFTLHPTYNLVTMPPFLQIVGFDPVFTVMKFTCMLLLVNYRPW